MKGRLPGTGGDAYRVRDAAGLTRLLGRLDCAGDLIVVSNRAPWIHSHSPAGPVARRPAGGLVTALETVLAAHGGCWIAHGSGDADRAVTDEHGHVRACDLPSSYRLRRLWLSADEVDGHYHGMSNDGLWPLCHDAGVAPVFCPRDWQLYRQVNRRFADAVAAEARSESPVVLVQDYHLALAPRMIRERLPRAIIIMFWHIPFPAPQRWATFAWREEVMDGLLCSDLVGLQTAADLAHFNALRAACPDRGMAAGRTMAGCFPVSIAWPERTEPAFPKAARRAARTTVERRFGIAPGVRVLLGVDRLDYTKGIAERLLAFECLLAQHPGLRGSVSLLQVTAPGRAGAPYRALESRVRALAHRINGRFGSGGWTPVILHLGGADAVTVNECYRACDVCLVTSLHDGMNLVAKEFVAARADLRGVLVLGRRAGAAGELRQALLTDPRDIPALAAAICAALAMPRHEQALRMAAMRKVVRRHTVYGWAARLLDAGVRAAGGGHVLGRQAGHVLEAAA